MLAKPNRGFFATIDFSIASIFRFRSIANNFAIKSNIMLFLNCGAYIRKVLIGCRAKANKIVCPANRSTNEIIRPASVWIYIPPNVSFANLAIFTFGKHFSEIRYVNNQAGQASRRNMGDIIFRERAVLLFPRRYFFRTPPRGSTIEPRRDRSISPSRRKSRDYNVDKIKK